MNVKPENIIVNSCEYTPVYLIQGSGVTQAGSYIIAQTQQDEQKPVTDNLKRFYENSGNLENGLLPSTSSKPRILKKQSNIVGNNLKLASFLLPKTENLQPISTISNFPTVTNITTIPNVQSVQKPIPIPPVPIPISNMAVKPPAPHPVSVDNGLPRVEYDRKIIHIGPIPNTVRTTNRTLPKMKPKEKVVETNPSRHTSVQLLKLGETYHSLNQLSEEQMKIVSKALKMFSNPEAPKEPAYDPVTNTKFIYKVVSPRDLTVVGKNKIIAKKKNSEIKKELQVKNQLDNTNISETLKSQSQEKQACESLKVLTQEGKKHEKLKEVLEEKLKKSPKKLPESRKSPKFTKGDTKRHLAKKIDDIVDEDEFDEGPSENLRTTRSGRTVRLPRMLLPRPAPRTAPLRPRKRHAAHVHCFQCEAEFCSLYRLQRHYENYPTHIPARIHTNLFHCLLAIIKAGSAPDQPSILVQQLQHLIDKLRSLLPCLLKMDGFEGRPCSIQDDIAKLLGMTPGKYNININALSCVKNKDGHCVHNPAPKPIEKPSQAQTTNNNEEVAHVEADTEDCARINSVAKWPTATQKILKLKQRKFRKANLQEIRLEESDLIELDVGNTITTVKNDISEKLSTSNTTNNAINAAQNIHVLSNNLNNNMQEVVSEEEKEDCARVHPVDRWPKATKRLWKVKSEILQNNDVKKIRLTSESEQFIDLGVDDNVTQSAEESALNATQTLPLLEDSERSEITQVAANFPTSIDQSKKLKPQFRSTHFDIRSSPIKLPSALVRKFQLNTDNLPSLEVQILRPLVLNKENDSNLTQVQDPQTQMLIGENDLQQVNAINDELTFQSTKDWDFTAPDNQGYVNLKSSLLFESELLDEKILDSTPTKAETCLFESTHKTMLESNLIQDKSSNSIEPSLIYEDKTDCLFKSEANLMQDSPSGYFEPSAIKTPKGLFESTLIEVNDKSFEAALSSVRERSNNLFEPAMLHSKQKCNSLVEPKRNGIFDSTLSHLKERSNSLYETGLTRLKDKDSLIGPSLIHDTLSRKDIMEPIHKSNGLSEDSPLNMKMKEEMSHLSSELNTSDSNQGQSVLNFLESLGSETLGLSYPETDIRNSSVDFQLDLFSFNSS